MSSQPCGCDPDMEIPWVCERHRRGEKECLDDDQEPHPYQDDLPVNVRFAESSVQPEPTSPVGVTSESEIANSEKSMGSPYLSTKISSSRKVGDVLFASKFPVNVLSMLITTTKPTLYEDSSASDATSVSRGSQVTQTPLSGAQDISVNPNTGGAKRTKPLRYDLIPVAPLAEVALLYGLGARLYEDRNWERGYDWSLSYAALQRHLNAFWAGEEWDEDGAHHLAAVVFHAFALMEFSRTHRELDTRGGVMRLIYVAGPFRGPNHWEIAQNIRRAEALALEVWKLGCACICPHLNTAHFQGALPDSVWIDGDLEILRRCDAVLLTSNWKSSSGATAERSFAIQHGIPIFYYLSELNYWLHQSVAESPF